MDLTSVGTSAQSFWSSINWAQPTWDLFIILFVIVAAFVYGLSLGRDRIFIIMVAIYMALGVVSTMPFLPGGLFNMPSPFLVKVSLFLGCFVLLFFFLTRSPLMKALAGSEDKGRWWQVLVFSVLHVGLLVSVTLNYLNPEVIDKLAPFTKQIFASPNARFGWVVAPIIALILFSGKSKEKKFKYEV